MISLMPIGLFALVLLLPSLTMAGEVDVVDVELVPIGEGRFQANVTLRHADEGWKHYADKWDIVAPDGQILGTRVLYHPHVEEQPFTRSLSLRIPAQVQWVEIRGHDLVHDYGGRTLKLEIPRRAAQ
jgi:hypothetical protein